jgi:hypothetical protein
MTDPQLSPLPQSSPLPQPHRQVLRIPRGLWNDLEETVIQQDRQFLTTVARELGLPVNDVLRRCLGMGAPQPVPVLWGTPDLDSTTDLCPWWECHGQGLWRRCPRLRVAATMPCQIHERCTPCPLSRLDSDPEMRRMSWVIPLRVGEVLYWVDPENRLPPRNEDGSLCTTRRFKCIQRDGEKHWILLPPRQTPG